jgi:hypothetical protein
MQFSSFFRTVVRQLEEKKLNAITEDYSFEKNHTNKFYQELSKFRTIITFQQQKHAKCSTNLSVFNHGLGKVCSLIDRKRTLIAAHVAAFPLENCSLGQAPTLQTRQKLAQVGDAC